jgi:hypothetical protein
MQAKKKASAAKKKTAAKKKASTRKSSAKRASTAKATAKRTKVRSTKTVTKRPAARAKKPSVRTKSPAKPGVGRGRPTARKAPIARKNTPKEVEPVEVSEATTQAPLHFELAREPARGGSRDGANHSMPEVQLQKQHIQTMRTPGGRRTIRGH